MGQARLGCVLLTAIAACRSAPAPDPRKTSCHDAAGCAAECDRSVAWACARASFIYEAGRGVPVDEARGRDLAMRAADLGERACDRDIDGCRLARQTLLTVARDRLEGQGLRTSGMTAGELAHSAPDLEPRITALAARIERAKLVPPTGDAAKACIGGDDTRCPDAINPLLVPDPSGSGQNVLPDAGWQILAQACANNVELACTMCWRPAWQPRDGACAR